MDKQDPNNQKPQLPQQPGPPPKPALVGTNMSIVVKFGDNTPFIMGEQKVTGDKNKDVFALPMLPIAYDGASISITNPLDPSQSVIIGVRKSSTIQKLPPEQVQHPTATGEKTSKFKSQVKQLRKP